MSVQAVSLVNFRELGEPVRSHSFDVYTGSAELPSVTITSIEVGEKLKLKFMVLENAEYPDLADSLWSRNK